MKLIDKDVLVAEIERGKSSFLESEEYNKNEKMQNTQCLYHRLAGFCDDLLSFINSLEVKEVDLELITGWFDHIAQIADDRMTLTNQRMTDAHALDEIKCLAKNSSEFITKHYKAQKGEKV